MIFHKQIEKIYQKQAFRRCNNSGKVFYFTHKDFEGLTCKEYAFKSSKGHRLQGYLYSMPNHRKGHLVIFDHGMGAGHNAYMKEIHRLAQNGFAVFSYDHTGCFTSEGSTTGGLSQSLHDLNDCINALQADKQFEGYTFSVMGHSWGGYSCLNIAKYHPELKHIITLAGFASVKRMVGSIFTGILKPYAKHILQLEAQSNPDYWGCDAADSLKNTNARVLVIHSEDDPTVRFADNFLYLKEALQDQANIAFLPVKGRLHNPNYTADASAYAAQFFAELTKKSKKKLLSTEEQKKAFVAGFDWHRMTAQDDAVWEQILNTLNQ